MVKKPTVPFTYVYGLKQKIKALVPIKFIRDFKRFLLENLTLNTCNFKDFFNNQIVLCEC